MTVENEAEETILRAVRASREGKEVEEKCLFCGGRIQVTGDPPGGPYTLVYFTCPCKKSAGYLKGL